MVPTCAFGRSDNIESKKRNTITLEVKLEMVKRNYKDSEEHWQGARI